MLVGTQKIKKIAAKCNFFFRKQREISKKLEADDQGAIKELSRYLSANRVVPLTDEKMKEGKEFINSYKNDIKENHEILRKSALNIKTYQHCLLKNEIQKWNIKTTDITESEEQPLTLKF